MKQIKRSAENKTYTFGLVLNTECHLKTSLLYKTLLRELWTMRIRVICVEVYLRI